MGIKATLAIDARDILGEGPTWDAADARLLWSDNKPGIIHEARADSQGGWRESRRWNLGRRIGAAIPRARGGLIVASGTEFLTLDEAGELTPFACLPADPKLFHLNDAKCDAQGRLWAGTLDGAVNIPGCEITPGRGALYRIDPDGAVTTMLENVTVSNGLAWSSDGSALYYIDSYVRSVDAFDFDTVRGTISNRRTIINVKGGAPDGMTIDREDCVWVAIAGAGEVRRYAPDGTFLACVEVSTPTVTSCAFGGNDGGELFITSSRVRLPPSAFTGLAHGFSLEVESSTTDTRAGGLFVCQPGVKGMPATPFAG